MLQPGGYERRVLETRAGWEHIVIDWEPRSLTPEHDHEGILEGSCVVVLEGVLGVAVDGKITFYNAGEIIPEDAGTTHVVFNASKTTIARTAHHYKVVPDHPYQPVRLPFSDSNKRALVESLFS